MDAQYESVVSMQNITIKCADKSHPASYCFYAARNYKRVKTPIFVVNSMYVLLLPSFHEKLMLIGMTPSSSLTYLPHLKMG